MNWNRIAAGRGVLHESRPAAGKPIETPSSFFAPLHYESNYAYPLLVWLGGSEEASLGELMPRVSLRNYVAVAAEVPTLEASVDVASRAVDEAMRRFHCSPERVFVAGALDAGTAAITAALGAPETFAGAASFCGAFPRSRAALADLKAVRSMPLLFCTSRRGRSYAENVACDDIRLLHAAGMLATFRQYPGDEEPHPQAYSDLDAWIMKQVNSDLASVGG